MKYPWIFEFIGSAIGENLFVRYYFYELPNIFSSKKKNAVACLLAINVYLCGKYNKKYNTLNDLPMEH